MPFSSLRYGDWNGDWQPKPDGRPKLFLTMGDTYWARAYTVGWRRFYAHRGQGDGYIAPSDVWQYRTDIEPAINDIEGACGETAMHLLQGREPPDEMLLSQSAFMERRRGGQILDVDGMEVRTTGHQTGRLIAHPELQTRDGRSRADVPYILVVLNAWPFHESRGFTVGEPAIDAALRKPRTPSFTPLPHFRGEIAIVGWAYGREFHDRPNWQGMPWAQPTMDQHELHPMHELPEPFRKFTIPEHDDAIRERELIAVLDRAAELPRVVV